MLQKELHPIEHYRKAFINFSHADEKDFEIKASEGALVRFEDITYRVCSYDDLLKQFKVYFKRYDLIFTETPFGLWVRMYEEQQTINQENLIIDVYTAWKIYWDEQRKLYENEEAYTESKAESWEDFNLLIEYLREGTGKLVENAIQLSDIILIPIIAIALKLQYGNEEAFYRKGLDLMIKEFPEFFASDCNFNEVDLNLEHPGTEVYYIFKPDYSYDNYQFGYL